LSMPPRQKASRSHAESNAAGPGCFQDHVEKPPWTGSGLFRYADDWHHHSSAAPAPHVSTEDQHPDAFVLAGPRHVRKG
jgi:hypothetical protein